MSLILELTNKFCDPCTTTHIPTNKRTSMELVLLYLWLLICIWMDTGAYLYLPFFLIFQLIRTLSRSLDSPTHASFTSIATSQWCATPTIRKSTSSTKQMLLQSPHLTNPDADFISPVPSLTSSAMPIPHTSLQGKCSLHPGEVTVTPTISKSIKRKSVGGHSINPKANTYGSHTSPLVRRHKLITLWPLTSNVYG